MAILLTGSLSTDEYDLWRAHLRTHLPPPDRLILAGEPYDPADIDIALVANPQVGEMARHPELKFIQSLWAGVDRLLSDPSLPNVPIARLVDPTLTQAMVECVVASVFSLHRQFPAYARQQAERQWRDLPQPLANQRAVGILGLGQLGRACARALASFGFEVSAWSRAARTLEGVTCLNGPDGLSSLLGSSAILVNLLPLTPETQGILDASTFAVLPVGAALVNVGRGRHLVEDDLLTALASGQLSHAILDVFAQEPLPADHPFWRHPRISVLPHVAAATDPATAARIAADNVRAFREGRPLSALVDRRRGY
jgi:glyoxylate/hydroxypyruvate reductase A